MRLLTFVGSAGSTCSGACAEVAAGRHLSAMDASDALCDENESFSSSFQLFLRLWREDENTAMNFLSSGGINAQIPSLVQLHDLDSNLGQMQMQITALQSNNMDRDFSLRRNSVFIHQHPLERRQLPCSSLHLGI